MDKQPSTIRVSDLLALQRRVLEKIARHAPKREVLVELCHLVEGLVEDSVCSVMQYHEEGDRLELVAAPSASSAVCRSLDGMSVSASKGNCAVSVSRRAIVIVEDTATDPLWKGLEDLAREHRIRSCWSVPFFSSRGSVLGSLGISRVVTGGPDPVQHELLRTAGTLAGITIDFVLEDARMREQDVLLRSIITCSEDPIFVKDTQGRYLLANAAETRGMEGCPAEVVGLTDQEVFPQHAAVCRRTDEEVLRTGRSIHYEHDFESPTAGRRTYLIRKSVLVDRNGEQRGVLGISRDVTELRQAEEALRRTQKLEWLGVLTGGIAHDFNNLLTGILGNAELALMRLEDSPEAFNLREIRRASVRAAELIRQMQAYAGQGVRRREILVLPEIVNEILELMTSTIAKNAELSFDIPGELPPVDVDATQIRQVVMNLVTNASEALDGKPGSIAIAMRALPVAELPESARRQIEREAERYVALQVKDSGCGMDASTLGRIFDPFFSTKFEGRGLGLAATLGIVRRHAGAIDVESRPGAGSCFRVFLPASTDEVVIRPAPPPADTEWRGRGRVLVVDDEPSVLQLASAILARAGFDTVTATTGSEAVAKLAAERGRVDLVLLDHTMPGWDAARTLANLRRTQSDVPIILTSGHDEDRARAGLSPDGGRLAGFLKKPYGSREMIEVVRSAIGTS